ncbi:hypothetical protein V493_01814 [Pseudogymnoascus sp. VKM F-4281 (FW-2241)]|nr:hypothetical protein V493_01814 [Pseudogymnoascus sp. VKM F-4281 (FW-2241)]
MVTVRSFDRGNWPSETERKPEMHSSTMGNYFDETRPMAEQAPKNMPINVALNEYCGIESTSFALAVIRPDGQISTFLSDDMKTDPKFLFTPEFQNELLVASGRQPLHHNTLSQTCNNAHCRRQTNASVRKRSSGPSNNVNDDDYSTDASRSPGGRKRIRANVTRSLDRVVPTVPTLPTRTITIGDDAARDEVYRQCLKNIQQNGCKIIGKAWVKLLEPKKQSTYPYTKGAQKRPPWWPAVTGPNNIRHKEPDHLHKRERIILLMHIIGLIVSQERNSPAQQRKVDVAKLEEVTREAMATWFADREKPKNAEKRGFLTQLFRVLYKEERYRRGELDGSTTVCVNDGAGLPDDEDDDDDDEECDVPAQQQLHQAQPISPFLPTPPALSPLHPINSTTASADMHDYYPPRVPLRSSYIPTPPDTTTGDDYTDSAYPIQHHATLTHNQHPPSYPTRAWPAHEMNIYVNSAWPAPPAAPSGPMQQYPSGMYTSSAPQQQGQNAVFLPPPMAQPYEDVNGGRGSFDGWEVI